MTYTATVLLSGGLDSTTLLAQTLNDGHHAYALSINYGQRHSKELSQAQTIADHYGVKLDVLDLIGLRYVLAGSALTGPNEVPDGHYAAENMSTTVVPNRNAILLSIAAGHAAARGHDYVATAVHAGDHPIYPDCRPEFILALSNATKLGTRTDDRPEGVQVVAPFVNMDKTGIAELALAYDVPVELTWSCYKGREIHCGRCGTCVERAEALDAATGGADPTDYDDPDFWREAVKSS